MILKARKIEIAVKFAGGTVIYKIYGVRSAMFVQIDVDGLMGAGVRSWDLHVTIGLQVALQVQVTNYLLTEK